MRSIVAAVACAATMAVTGTSAQAQQFPNKPVEVSAWGAAGGGLDVMVRLVGKVLEKELGVSVVVVNRPGGGGGVSMSHVWNKPHDGYNWLGASEGMQNAAILGFHTTTTKDWRWYIIGGGPAVLGVRADSPFKTYEDFLKAAEANPGKVNVGHCQPGCVFHLKTVALASGTKIKLNSVPYAGGAPAMVGLLAGDSDAVVTSIGEQLEYVKAGRMRPLGMLQTEPYNLDGQTIPAIGSKFPDIMAIPTEQYGGFAVPADAPKNVLDRIDAAFEKAVKDPELIKTFRDRHMGISGLYGDAAMKKLLAMESQVSWKLYELGIAKISPDTIGIAKP